MNETFDQQAYRPRMWMESINRDELLSVVGPALDRGGVDEIARRVSARWTPRQLCQMLHDEEPDVRKIGCVILGLVGDRRTVACLAAALRDGDAGVNQLAEHAMWSIWSRSGSPAAQRLYQRGIHALDGGDAALAARLFTEAGGIDPTFAEAHGQCAIARYMLEDFAAAIADARRCVELEPHHFGALATLGHCHAHLGELAAAARFYRRAASVNPRLDAITAAACRIDRASALA